MGPDRQPVALEARHISKRFGGTLALDRAGIELRAGEVHALLGENGSGKSTLIKVLAGYHVPEPGGAVEVRGRPAPLPLTPIRARMLGLRFVHQDLGLIPSLSVLENLRLEELAAARGLRIPWRAERRRALATFARFGADLDPRATVSELRPAERALLAVVRALEDMPEGGVLVLDEPTSLLPAAEREGLVALVRRIADEGSSVLLVSHDLAEARQLADRVTVLRDGRNVGSAPTRELDGRRLVEMVVGDVPEAGPAAAAVAAGARVLVSGVCGETVRDVSLQLAPGEALGVTGLPGSGFDELPYLLFGASPGGGRLVVDEEIELASLTPDRALRCGIALLPADRQGDGAVGSLSVAANVTLPRLRRYAGVRFDRSRLRRDAARILAEQDVRPSDPELIFDALSGGNQQKALLAKWLDTDPALLLLHEPTRGVDVGARARITATLRALARQGVAILCASADHEQLAALCSRVVVFSGGRPAAELSGAQVTKEEIAKRCHSLSG